MPPAVVVVLPSRSATENDADGSSVIVVSADGVTSMAHVVGVPAQTMAAIVPFVMTKSAAVTVVPASVSLLAKVKAIVLSLVGETWPAAVVRVTVGAVESYVTTRS